MEYYTPCTLSFHMCIYITECVYTVYLYPCLYLYGYYRLWSVSTLNVDPYSISISMFVSIWILWNVECSYTPCTLSFHIHIYICIHIDITECVYYCVSISMSVSIWVLQIVECLHTQCRPILHIHIHVCIHMDIMKCGV